MSLAEVITCVQSDIEFIKNNTNNAFILKSCNILTIKLQDIIDKKYKTKEVVYEVCDKIVNYDVRNMRFVPELSDELYSKIDELAVHAEQIKETYFEE